MNNKRGSTTMRNQPGVGSELPYATAAAFRAALKAKFTEIAQHDPRFSVAELQRQFAYDRILSRCFSADDADQWMLKGAGALLARLPGTRHSKDIDLYYAERSAAPDAAVAALARVADRDLGDHFRFELTKTTPLQETAKGRRVHLSSYLGSLYATFHVDVVVDTSLSGEPDKVPPLTPLRIDGLLRPPYRAFPLPDHCADKLCAIIATSPSRPTRRSVVPALGTTPRATIRTGQNHCSRRQRALTGRIRYDRASRRLVPALEHCMPLDPTARDPILDRAIRLFQYLMRVQEVRDEPARTVEAYRREGAVLWFGDLPHHPTVRSATDEAEPEAGSPFLTVDRAPRLAPPAPDDRLAVWLDGPRDDPDTEPLLRSSITRAGNETVEEGRPAVRAGRAPRRAAGDRRVVPELASGLASVGGTGAARPADPRALQRALRDVRECNRTRRGAGAGHRRRLPRVDPSRPSDGPAALADRPRRHRVRRRLRTTHGRARRGG
ncbi:MAG: nucleotidyl transferase AbiEii/AbiGii toxin family protein [Pseudonocardiaceae bacterium]